MSDDRIDYTALAIPKPTRAERATKRLGRKVPLKARNVERHDRTHAEMFGAQAQACRELPCCVCGFFIAGVQQDPHHEPPGGDDSCTVPLCRICHTNRHSMGEQTFWSYVDLDPADIQQAVRDWMDAGKPQGALPRYRRDI